MTIIILVINNNDNDNDNDDDDDDDIILYNEQRKTRVLIGLEECVIRVWTHD